MHKCNPCSYAYSYVLAHQPRARACVGFLLSQPVRADAHTCIYFYVQTHLYIYIYINTDICSIVRGSSCLAHDGWNEGGNDDQEAARFR